MLNKENRTILKSLKGEYKRFAKKLSRSAFLRCEGRRAINENLAEMFALLQNAQEQGKPFDAAIPDAEATIRETLLYFPPKRTWRIALIWVFSALFIISAAVGGGVWYWNLTQQPVEPIYSPGTINEVRYDRTGAVIEWSGLNNIDYYVVSLIDPETNKEIELGRPREHYLLLDALDKYHVKYCFEKAANLRRDTVDVKIFAKSKSELFFDYETRLPMYFYTPTERSSFVKEHIPLTDYHSSNGWEKLISWEFLPREEGNLMPFGKLIYRYSDCNFYGRIDNPEDVIYILEDSAPTSKEHAYKELDPNEINYFRGDYEYTFVLKPSQQSTSWCKLEISIPNIRDYIGKLPAGRTIFAMPDDDEPIALASGNEAVTLSVFHVSKSREFLSSIYYSKIFPTERWLDPGAWRAERHFYVANNQSGTEQAFYVQDAVIDFEAETFQKTITLQPGYTTLRVKPWEGAPNTDAGVFIWYDFSIITKHTINYYCDNPRVLANSQFREGLIRPTSGLYAGMREEWYAHSKTNDFLITLYVREETEIIVEGQKTEGGEWRNWPQMSGTVRLKPGYTKVNLIYQYTLLTSEDKYEINHETLPYFSDSLNGYIVYVHGSCYIFNPNDYEIEINASEVKITIEPS